MKAQYENNIKHKRIEWEEFNMSKNVTVYSSDTCIYCHEAKKYLDSLGVSYTEKNISKDMEARKELMAQGFMGVPVIVVDGETIQGFDKARLDLLLK